MTAERLMRLRGRVRRMIRTEDGQGGFTESRDVVATDVPYLLETTTRQDTDALRGDTTTSGIVESRLYVPLGTDIARDDLFDLADDRTLLVRSAEPRTGGVTAGDYMRCSVEETQAGAEIAEES